MFCCSLIYGNDTSMLYDHDLHMRENYCMH